MWSFYICHSLIVKGSVIVCSVQLTLVVCSLLCNVVSSNSGRGYRLVEWLSDSSSETTAHRLVWMELRTCLRDRVKEKMGFITVITLIEYLTRLMKSLTRALGPQRVLCAGCWWFGQGCWPVSAAYGCTASFAWHTLPKESGSFQ